MYSMVRRQEFDALAVFPSDLRPIGGGERLRQGHQRIDRDQLPVQFTQLGEIGLAAQHDRFGPQIAARGMQRRMRAGGEVGHRRLLIDRGAAPLDEPRQSAHQLARMDGGGVFVIDRAKRARDPDALFELRSCRAIAPDRRARIARIRHKPLAPTAIAAGRARPSGRRLWQNGCRDLPPPRRARLRPPRRPWRDTSPPPSHGRDAWPAPPGWWENGMSTTTRCAPRRQTRRSLCPPKRSSATGRALAGNTRSTAPNSRRREWRHRRRRTRSRPGRGVRSSPQVSSQ